MATERTARTVLAALGLTFVTACSAPGADSSLPPEPTPAASGDQGTVEQVVRTTTSSRFPIVVITCRVPETITTDRCRELGDLRLTGAPADLALPIAEVEVEFVYDGSSCRRFNSSLLAAGGTALEMATAPCPPM